MALISMCVYSTPENKKDDCLLQTLLSLTETVDFSKHRLILSVNCYTETTLQILNQFKPILHKVIFNDTNLGTAEGINKAWAFREKGEHLLKMDDDITHQYPDATQAIERCACAIGEDIISRQTYLSQNCTLVLLSPVAGG